MMTEIKTSENKNLHNRKVITKKAKYKMPELNERELLLGVDEMEYEQEKTESWFESFNNKSQYDITENLCAQTW